MSTLTTSDFSAYPVDSQEILRKAQEAFVFGQVSRSITLPAQGTYFYDFTSSDAEFATEGSVKPIDKGVFKRVEVAAKKFAKGHVWTMEVALQSGVIDKFLYEDLANIWGSTLNKVVAGDTGVGSNFDYLGDVQESAFSSPEGFHAALAEIEALGVTPSAVVLSTSLYRWLKGARNDLGLPLFNIGDNTIEGIPYVTYRSAEMVGFVGPFADRAVWGVTAGFPEVKVLDEVAEIDGVVHALKQRNEIGVLGEILVGFRVADKSEFRKLVLSDY